MNGEDERKEIIDTRMDKIKEEDKQAKALLEQKKQTIIDNKKKYKELKRKFKVKKRNREEMD